MVSWLTFLELYARLQRIPWFPSLKKQLTNPLRWVLPTLKTVCEVETHSLCVCDSFIDALTKILCHKLTEDMMGKDSKKCALLHNPVLGVVGVGASLWLYSCVLLSAAQGGLCKMRRTWWLWVRSWDTMFKTLSLKGRKKSPKVTPNLQEEGGKRQANSFVLGVVLL